MATGQIGYKSRFYRSGVQINHARKIEPILLQIAKIDATDLESPGFTKEYVRGFSDPPEVAVDFKYVNGDVNQQTLVIDGYAGTTDVETFKIELRNPTTDALQCTLTFPAYVSQVGIGPMEAESLVMINAKFQISGAVTVAFV